MNYGGIEVMLGFVLDRLGKEMTDPEKRAMSDAIVVVRMQASLEEAMMKQVPEIPTIEEDNKNSIFRCPKCRYCVGRIEVRKSAPPEILFPKAYWTSQNEFCPNCGQKIEWKLPKNDAD